MAMALLAAPGVWAAVKSQAGAYEVELATDPAVIPIGKAQLRIEITDRSGQPVTGADVRAIAEMPGMKMGEREEVARPVSGEPGVYAAPVMFSMAGAYTATVKIAGPQGAATAKIPLQTGQNTAAGGEFALLELLPWLIVLLIVAFILYRVWLTGQRPNWRAVLNRQVLGGLLLLAAMLAVSMYAVRNYRRQGAMTPIEAQAMEMSTPAPPGTAPVELAVVERGPVASTVRYTGQAVANVEQDVFPRVTGWITWMPFYAGDRVKRGQLLARLDTSQVEPQVAERRAAQNMAQQAASVARAEYQQALEAVSQARAELTGRRGALTEARAEVSAAQAERANAEADLAAVETQVADAAAGLEAARADQEYWRQQIRRTEALLKEGAVSGEEFQREKAQAENAEAKVRQAQARVTQVPAQVRAARSAVGKADALIRSAQAKVRQAEAALRAGEAQLRSAQAAVNAARQRIAQAQAGVEQARAGVSAATTARGYTKIHSLVDGVVTQRLISPGVLVNPGQAVLKVAQIRPIRLQANVAETDRGRIEVGSPVRMWDRDGRGQPVSARVTSIAPAVDPAARTGVVEAVVPNRDERFLPGEYVVMEITTRRSANALRVPARAVQQRTVPSEGTLSTQTEAYVWVAEPISEQEGQYAVRQVAVRIGASSGVYTEVLSGLEAGQRVVVSGYQYLQNGDTVAPTGTAVARSGGAAPAATTGEGRPPAAPHDHSSHGAPASPDNKPPTTVPAAQRYTCPMHPEVVQDGPGKCPKCGMDLVPQKGTGS
jgi:RND family efflux transporter MFP subunit